MARLRKRKKPKITGDGAGRSKKELKKLKKEQIMTLLMAFLMVGSIAGFLYFGGESQQFEYNGRKFVLTHNNRWELKDKSIRPSVSFDYLPQEVEHIAISKDIISAIKNSYLLVVTYDFNEIDAEAMASAQFEMETFLIDNMGMFNIFNAFTTENPFGIPVMDCQNATAAQPVILFRSTDHSNNTKIYKEEECIIFQGFKRDDFAALKDRLVYGLLGVI